MNIDRNVSQSYRQHVDALPEAVRKMIGETLTSSAAQLCSRGWKDVGELLGYSGDQLKKIGEYARVRRELEGFTLIRDWASRGDGSTIYVLLRALQGCGRLDCVELLEKAVEELNSITLYICVERDGNYADCLLVKTVRGASLEDSIINILENGGTNNYTIVQPPNCDWRNRAESLTGQMITIRELPNTINVPVEATEVQGSDSLSFCEGGHMFVPVMQSNPSTTSLKRPDEASIPEQNVMPDSSHPTSSEISFGINEIDAFSGIPGVCKKIETQQKCEQHLKHFLKSDGCYMVWFDRKYQQLRVSVSHLGEILHYTICKIRGEGSTVRYRIDEDERMANSVLELIGMYNRINLGPPKHSRTATSYKHVHLEVPVFIED